MKGFLQDFVEQVLLFAMTIFMVLGFAVIAYGFLVALRIIQ